MRRAVSLFALAAMVTGCAARPDAAPARLPTGDAFLRGDAATPAAAPEARWWTALGDGQLDALVARALDQAPSLAAAEARLRQARAGARASRAALLPVLGASALYVHADLPDQALGGTNGNIELYSLGFDAQWEADLWGGKRAEAGKAEAEAGVAAARLADLRVSLSAEVARAYVGLRAREASLGLVGRRLEAERALVSLARLRLSGGTGTRQELSGAEARVARSEAERAALAADAAVLRDMLAVLTGEAPGALDALPPGDVPLPPASVAIGDPAGLLARRPDVMAAERRLAASGADVAVARARRFPSLSLTGLVGLGATSLGDLFDTSRASILAIPRLTWNFLDFGRTAAALDAAKAGREAAEADYRGAVLGALGDAEGALARFGAARVALVQAGQGARHAAEIARLQQMRARAGTTSGLEAHQAEIAALDAALAEANARANLTLAHVALAKALGLGWAVPAEQGAAPAP